MTSPDNIVPRDARGISTISGLQNVTKKTAADSANSDVKTLLDELGLGFINVLLGGFDTVVDAVSSGVSEFLGLLSETFTGVEDGDFNDLGSWVNNLLNRDQNLASRVANLEGKIAVGADFYDDFNRGNNLASLGPRWTQGGDGEELGIYDQAAQLDFDDLLPDDGKRYAIAAQQTTGDNFVVSAVIHPKNPPPTAPTHLIARANATMTAGLSVNMFAGKCYLSRFTRNPTTNAWSFTDIDQNLSVSYSGSATVQFMGDGITLSVLIDGKKVLGGDDTVHAMGPNNRNYGFALSCYTAFFQTPQFSVGLASFALRSTADVVAVAAATAKAEAAQETATAVQSQVAQIIAKDQQEISQGVIYHESFDRPDSTSIGNGWTQQHSGVPGNWGIVNGEVYYYLTAGQGGTSYDHALAPVSFMTDSQSMSTVLGRRGNGSSVIRGWVRWDGNFASPTGIYWEQGEGFYRLVAVSNGTETQLDRRNIDRQAGDSIEIRAGDSGGILVKRNGATILSANDSGLPKGAGFRRFGIQTVVLDAYFNQYYPSTINSVDASDFAPPMVRGTTWRAARLAAANSSSISSGDQRLPANTFGTVYASTNIVLDSSGVVTIPIEGTYIIKFRLWLTNSNNGYVWRPCIWKMLAGQSNWAVDQYGTDTMSPDSNEQLFVVGDTFLVYAKEGDKIAIGFRQAGSVMIRGSAGGIDTHWSGVLV